ncbi:MAG: hypothetical protein FJ104_07740 [Deltaproteobacteria bacterium]|nr:hypothetical protein [Deltaproteobacteria bacterium]
MSGLSRRAGLILISAVGSAATVAVVATTDEATEPNLTPSVADRHAPGERPAPDAPGVLGDGDLTEPRTDAFVGDADGTTIRPTFNWPRGTVARVEFSQTRARGDVVTFANASRWTLEVRNEPGERLRLEYSDPASVFAANRRGSIAAPATVEGLVPTLIVRSDGSFERIADDARHLSQLRELVERTAGQNLSARPALEQTLLAALRTRSKGEWELWVASWVDQELELGAEYESSADVPLPVPGAGMVHMRSVSVATGMVPCTVGAHERRCIRIETTSDADREQLERADPFGMEALLGPEFRNVAARIVRYQSKTSVVTEPDGLVPHWSEVVRSNTMTYSDAGETKTVSSSDRLEHRFRYPRP